MNTPEQCGVASEHAHMATAEHLRRCPICDMRFPEPAKLACENYRFGRDDTHPADVILALAPLTGVADEIRALLGGDQ